MLRFGRLTVIGSVGRSAEKVKCLCSCGNEVSVQYGHLKSGHTKSCGCLSVEVAISSNTKHGMSKTPEYRTWTHIKSRCTNKNHHAFDSYGGRGIKVCERWLNSFKNFIDDMGLKPDPSYSIDRIDNNGDYTPENCKWSSRKEQNRNTRKNTYVYVNGERMAFSQACEKYNIPYQRALGRKSMGWSIERILEIE